MLNRQQAIAWTNADPVHWCICTALGWDELNNKVVMLTNWSSLAARKLAKWKWKVIMLMNLLSNSQLSVQPVTTYSSMPWSFCFRVWISVSLKTYLLFRWYLVSINFKLIFGFRWYSVSVNLKIYLWITSYHWYDISKLRYIFLDQLFSIRKFEDQFFCSNEIQYPLASRHILLSK